MDEKTYLAALESRTVSYRYAGKNLDFGLSTALFSSAAVDSGTALLLRLIEKSQMEPGPSTILDLGCGTGTLGICLSAATGAELIATDRDALACWFTERNAARNAVPARTIATFGLPGDLSLVADLAVCNIPAKAGGPVILSMIRALCDATRSGGRAGFVIVNTLAELLTHSLADLNVEIVARHQSANHLAVVVEPDNHEQDVSATSLSTYVRSRVSFAGAFDAYEMDVVYNLPEFDSISYATSLVFDLLREREPGGNGMIWGTGQGHIACGGLRIRGSRRENAPTLLVGDRDSLAVAATIANINRVSPGRPVTGIVSPGLAAFAAGQPAGSADWLVVNSAPEPGSLWNREILDSALHLLAPEGRLIVASRSTSVARLGGLDSWFTRVQSKKHRGYRSDSLIRKR